VTVADLETRATRDDHEALRLWLRLLATTHLIEGRVRRGLQERYATTLPRFDLMSQLDRAPEGLKMGELSRRMMVTGGNVTGITDGLEAEGLVERSPDTSDRRALRVRLTTSGRRAFRAMAAEHERWIVDMFGTLNQNQMTMLADLLGRLKQHLRTYKEEQA
jgi:DNA-binding MarR family transcriptional regulator